MVGEKEIEKGRGSFTQKIKKEREKKDQIELEKGKEN